MEVFFLSLNEKQRRRKIEVMKKMRNNGEMEIGKVESVN